jgi:hypothetical protein
MVDSKAASVAEGKEDLYEPMVFICADNASEKKQKKWDLKNFHKGG